MLILGILQRGCESKENSDFEAKIRGVNSVSDEKLHDFEIIFPARAVRSQPLCLRTCNTKTYCHFCLMVQASVILCRNQI